MTTTPDADDFRALARSAPWRFAGIHFIHRSYRGGELDPRGSAEAWLDRSRMRLVVRCADGVEVSEGVPYSTMALTAFSGPEDVPAVPVSPRDMATLRPDGLVSERPAGWHLDHGDPMWRDYRWTAMLDPAELAHGVAIDAVSATTRHERATWSALCRPVLSSEEGGGDGYHPRCGCCPLLDTIASRVGEYGPDEPMVRDSDLPVTYEVLLDVQTAVVVSVRAADGRQEKVLDNDIISVDDPDDRPPDT